MLQIYFLDLFPWSSIRYAYCFFSNLTKSKDLSLTHIQLLLPALLLSTQTADPRKSIPSMWWWCLSYISINKSPVSLGTTYSLPFPPILLSSPISACPDYQVLLSPTGFHCLLPIICWTSLFLPSTTSVPAILPCTSIDFLPLQGASTSQGVWRSRLCITVSCKRPNLIPFVPYCLKRCYWTDSFCFHLLSSL